jgi:hypothetical protein
MLCKPPKRRATQTTEDRTEPIKDVLVPAVIMIVGAFLGYWFARRLERKKAEIQSNVRRIEDKLKSCTELKLFLAEWFNEIAKATTFEESPEKTLAKLAAFIERKHFEVLLVDKVRELSGEPLCEELIKKANFYKAEALRGKGNVKVGLEGRMIGQFSGGYGWRGNDPIIDEVLSRADRKAVIDYLDNLYNDFAHELDRVRPLLEDKKRKIEQSL